MTITAQHVEQVLRRIPGAYGRQITSLAVLAAGANQALAAAPAGLTVQGAAAFLATMSQESASLRTTEEYAKNGRYAPYIGRTFEQLTWKNNYRAFGRWCVARGLLADAEAFVKKPKKLADVEWAWLGGVWFWQAKSIWPYGNRGDFLATQRAVNLGNPHTTATPNGIAARRAWYAAWLAIGDDLLPAPTTEGSEHLMATGTEIDRTKQNIKQPLTPGAQGVEVYRNTDKDKSIVVGPSDGVDVTAVLEVKNADGSPAGDVGIRAYFVVVSYKDKTPTTVVSANLATAGDTAHFKGKLAKIDGRSPRLRLRIDVPASAPAGLYVDWVQYSGWEL